MSKIKITDNQVFVLTASFTCGSASLAISSTAANFAKQDSWISMIITIILGLIEVWLICFLWNHFSNMTYVEMISAIFGRYVGPIISIGFVFFCLVSVSQILSYIGSFMTVEAMPETPVYAVNTMFLIAIIVALAYGLETFCRCYEILIYFASLLFIVSMILVLPNINIENLQPVFEGGIIPIIKGTFILYSFLVLPLIILLMVFPAHADNTAKAKKSFFKGYLWGENIIFISILFSILVLGSTITADSQYPVYMLAKEINVGTIFTRLEFFVTAVWIITLLTRGILYFYAGIIGISQILKLKNHKKIILPLGFILLIISEIIYPDVMYKSAWDTFVWPPYVATFGLILPISMVIGLCIKGRHW